nr:transposase [Sphingobium sp.]
MAYLSRYTHRVAISNRRLVAFDRQNVTFRYKDYRCAGDEQQDIVTISADEFIRRFRSMSYHAASTPSATMGCSPVPRAKPISRVPANSSTSSRRHPTRANRTDLSTCFHPVPAAVGV